MKTVVGGPSRHTERGLVEILLKVASHPHVNIASIAIQTIPLLFSPENSIVREALPVLQRRAIIPHEIVDDKMELKTESYADVSFEDFLDFREHVLSDTLVECWKTDGQGFFDSCTSAIEEFCTKDSSLSVSLFLEAAIFCIEGVGSTVMSSHHPCEQTEHLKRCTQALVSRPGSLLANPFTLSRMAGMIQKVSARSMCLTLTVHAKSHIRSYPSILPGTEKLKAFTLQQTLYQWFSNVPLMLPATQQYHRLLKVLTR